MEESFEESTHQFFYPHVNMNVTLKHRNLRVRYVKVLKTIIIPHWVIAGGERK
jgi:hypothetical protein